MRMTILTTFVFGTAIALGAPAYSAAADGASPIPICANGDGKTPIAMWAPQVDADNDARVEPPQQDGQIVHIQAAVDSQGAECNNTTLYTISIPNRNKEPGGLAVNIKGNAQFANGRCVLSGYYMNEDVPGMHQGWLETYFGSVDKQKIMLSSKFCLERSID